MGDAQDVPEIGERAKLIYLFSPIKSIGLGFANLAFVHCNAVVHIRMVDNATEDDLIAYAKRLDKRIKMAVCR